MLIFSINCSILIFSCEALCQLCLFERDSVIHRFFYMLTSTHFHYLPISHQHFLLLISGVFVSLSTCVAQQLSILLIIFRTFVFLCVHYKSCPDLLSESFYNKKILQQRLNRLIS